jgi:hypothetical protein
MTAEPMKPAPPVTRMVRGLAMSNGGVGDAGIVRRRIIIGEGLTLVQKPAELKGL